MRFSERCVRVKGKKRRYEFHLSAEKEEKKEHTRVFEEEGHPRGACRSPSQKAEGAEAPLSVASRMNPAESSLFSVRTAPRGFHRRPLVVFVGKKAAKQAATRNLIKRRIVAAFKRAAPGAPARDILLSAKPAISKATYADIEREVRRIFGSL